MVDDFLAMSLAEGGPSGGRCSSFREAVEAIAKQGFRYYLGVSAQLAQPSSPDAKELYIHMDDLPLADYVQLPEVIIKCVSVCVCVLDHRRRRHHCRQAFFFLAIRIFVALTCEYHLPSIQSRKVASALLSSPPFLSLSRLVLAFLCLRPEAL